MSHGSHHGHGHGHGGDGDAPPPRIGTLARLVVLVVLAAAGAASVVGVVTLWPEHSAVQAVKASQPFAAAGVTYPRATVERVYAACPVSDGTDGSPAGSPVPDGTCGTIRATVTSGTEQGQEVSLDPPPEVVTSGLEKGDRIELQLTPAADGQPGQASYYSTVRNTPLLLLLLVFVVVVLAVARWRGLMALVGLAFSAGVIGLFVLPALLTGEAAVPVAAAGSTAIMFVVLFTTHGFSLRTATALVGTLTGVAVSAGVGLWAVGGARLTGVSDEGARVLQTFAGGLDFQGLLVAAIIVAGLGVLNDVTITQASAVWELRGASPDLTRRQVFAAAMRIGRDHIASTIYTIVFAYAGTALTVLLVISVYDRPLLDLVGTEEISEEVVRSLVSSIGLVLAVPLTTAIAALTVGAPSRSRPGRRRA